MTVDPLRAPDLSAITGAFLSAGAEFAEHGSFRVAGLASLVGFKRLAGRPQDRADLIELEAIHGELPVDPIPGLDT